MAEQKNEGVEDVERVEIAPAGGDDVEETADGDEPEAESEGGGEEGAEGAAPVRQTTVHSKQTPAAQAGDGDEGGGEPPDGGDGEGTVGADGLRDVPGETPRERALRAQLKEARGRLRQERTEELGLAHGAPASQAAPAAEISEETKRILAKYPANEVAGLREVIPILAKEMGFVKADDLTKQSYESQAEGVLQGFLDQHKEYLPENDHDGTLWNAFKAEFALYNKPANPKDYQKIFNRVHTAIFGIKPAGDQGALTAARKKIEVASHAGASAPGRTNGIARQAPSAAALRLDMLKGFSDEELAEMQ